MLGLIRLILLASLLSTLTEAFSWRWRLWKPKKLRDSIPAPVELSDPYPLFKKAPLVRLPYGTYLGKDQLFTRVYKGIPYAVPPTGSNRFMPPRPPKRVFGIQPALKFGFGCYQDPVSPPLNGILLNRSEDCLNVNVWAPKYHSALDEALPVMVWILPGGFTSGYTSNPLYDGASIIRNAKEKVIVVTFDYRMGFFGWSAGRHFEKAGLMNMGLRDCMAAFEWVKKHIHAFGGDPTRVTAFGESAGGIIIGALMLINGGHQELFDQAIIESGTTGYTLPYMSEKTQGFERVLAEVGCDQTDEVIKCLQRLPADVLANNTLTGMVDPFPLIDKVLVKEQPIVSFAEGRFSKIPLMVGTCTHEGTFFTAGKVKSRDDIQPLLTYLLPFLRDEDFTDIFATYDNAKYNNSAYLEASDIVGDRFFQCPSLDLAKSLADQNVTVFKYRWNHSPELLRYLNFYGGKLGAFHFSEVAFIFSARPLYTSREEYRLSDAAIHAWTTFAKTGSPEIPNVGTKEVSLWPVYKTNGEESETRQNVVFGVPMKQTVSESDAFRDDVCAVWRRIEGRRDKNQVSSSKSRIRTGKKKRV